MCRLFAYKTKNPTKTNKVLLKSLAEFRELSNNGCVPCGIAPGHNDGWGIVAYKSGSPFLFVRSPKGAAKDPIFEQALEILKTSAPDIVIAHLRKTTEGGNSIKNTHPFLSDNISFCHNGTIHKLSQNKNESDSYTFFKKIILDPIQNKKEAFKNIYNELSSSYSYTAINTLFSEGNSIIATRNWNEKNPLAERMQLKDYYTLFSFKNSDSTFICSEKIKSLSKFETKLLKNKSISTF